MYNLKLYDIDGTFLSILNLKDLKSEITFTATENQGQGECSLVLDYDFNSEKIKSTNIIKIYRKQTLIYTGIVQNIKRIITKTTREIEVPLLGIGTISSYLLYQNESSYVFQKNDNPSNIIKEIIDFINTIYIGGWLSYDENSIQQYSGIVSIDFQYNNCFEALQKCIEITNFKLYIDQEGKVFFKEKSSTSDHTFIIGKDVEELKFEEDTEKIVNNLILEWKSGIDFYSDSISDNLYKKRDKFIKKTDIADQHSADEFGNNYISLYKNKFQKTTVVINKNYDIQSIKIGDTIQIKNFDFEIKNLQIVKFNYTNNSIKLELDYYNSFGKEFNS